MDVDASELVAKVAELAVKADGKRVEVIPLDRHDPSGEYLIRDHATNQTERVVPEPAPRQYGALRLADVVAIVKHFAGISPSVTLPEAISDGKVALPFEVKVENQHLPIFVWVNGRAVTAVLGETGRRRERVTLGLKTTKQFDLLCGWDTNPNNAWLKHPDFIHMLRVGLNAEYQPANLIDVMRNLKFKSSEQGGSSVVAGGGSLGRAVEARALGIDENGLPEDVMVRVPIYEQLTAMNEVDLVEYTIACTMDVEPTNQRMRLVPKSGEIESVLRQAQAAIVETLRGDLGGVTGVKVFRGDPG